jgi:hypothetical protein
VTIERDHADSSRSRPPGDDRVDRRLEDWRRRLIDLSHRNRLIAFKATKATTLLIAAPSVHELLADPERAQPWDFHFPPPAAQTEAGDASDTASAVDRIVLSSHQTHRSRRPNEIEVGEPNPAQALGLAAGQFAREQQALGPGDEVVGDHDEGQPDAVALEVAEIIGDLDRIRAVAGCLASTHPFEERARRPPSPTPTREGSARPRDDGRAAPDAGLKGGDPLSPT